MLVQTHNGNVLPICPMTISLEDAERLVAYFVVLAISPAAEIATASQRIVLVNCVIAGQRLGRETLTSLTEVGAARRDLVQALRVSDEMVIRWSA